MKYIDNDIQSGIAYDHKKIKRELKREKIIPADVYNPLKLPLHYNMWYVIMSERSRGKTTNVILLGLIMHRLYGTTIEYIRQSKDEIRPKVTETLFNTIIEYGYIQKIFPQYNSVQYKWTKWYLCYRDDKGELIDIAPDHFMSMLSIDQAASYKSGYNAPRGDFIIYDEFISKKWYQPSFVDFCDLLKTVARERNNILVFCLSNMIDQTADFFEELEIDEVMLTMQPGDSEIITTEQGTNVYAEIIPSDESVLSERRKKQNRTLFGFKNPKLVGITGGSWMVESYPHIEKDKEFYTLMQQGVYISFKNNLYRLKPVQDLENGQIYVHCFKASRYYPDSIILSLEQNYDPQYYYGLGKELYICNLIFKWYSEKRFRYSTNSIGHNIEKYIHLSRV